MPLSWHSEVTWRLVLWRMLTYADVCWRMLTYADVCRRCFLGCWRRSTSTPTRHAAAADKRGKGACVWRGRCISRAWDMLTYAGVCWRMLTYADALCRCVCMTRAVNLEYVHTWVASSASRCAYLYINRYIHKFNIYICIYIPTRRLKMKSIVQTRLLARDILALYIFLALYLYSHFTHFALTLLTLLTLLN
jgi:hypothetical protein